MYKAQVKSTEVKDGTFEYEKHKLHYPIDCKTDGDKLKYRQLIRFRAVARKHGMANTELFERFMIKRFPDEYSDDYIAEWVGRFQSGNPIAQMDSTSRKAYTDAIAEFDKGRKASVNVNGDW
jgi:hypothetical protein